MPALDPGPAGLPRTACVAIHDVAPATWPDCLRLWQALRAVADIPLTWLVVPHYHGRATPPGQLRAYLAALEDLLARGHELALHGYTHLDGGPPPRGLREACLRRLWTHGEGEFAALDAQQAQLRLGLGQAWFARHGWPLRGFVAPAWLLGDGAWSALRASRLRYTTTWRDFHLLRSRQATVRAPCLVYAARNGAGRCLSRAAVALMARQQARAPLLRFALHPPDARHPALLRHAQHMLAAVLAGRVPMTKAAFAACLAQSCGQWGRDSATMMAD